MRTNSTRYIWEHILSHQWLKECGTRMLIERQMEEYRQKTHTWLYSVKKEASQIKGGKGGLLINDGKTTR